MKSEIHIRKFNIFFDKEKKRLHLYIRGRLNEQDLVKFGWLVHNLTYFMLKNGLDYSIYYYPNETEDRIKKYSEKEELIFLASMDDNSIEKIEEIIRKIKEIVES